MNDTLQYGPWPYTLQQVVEAVRYRPGWEFTLESLIRSDGWSRSGGLMLRIGVRSTDTRNPTVCGRCGNSAMDYETGHLFTVPNFPWDHRGWTSWLFDCIKQAEVHEAAEFFALAMPQDSLADEERWHPYLSLHGQDKYPYDLQSNWTDELAEATFPNPPIVGVWADVEGDK